MEAFKGKLREESIRYNNVLTQQKSNQVILASHWPTVLILVNTNTNTLFSLARCLFKNDGKSSRDFSLDLEGLGEQVYKYWHLIGQ